MNSHYTFCRKTATLNYILFSKRPKLTKTSILGTCKSIVTETRVTITITHGHCLFPSLSTQLPYTPHSSVKKISRKRLHALANPISIPLTTPDNTYTILRNTIPHLYTHIHRRRTCRIAQNLRTEHCFLRKTGILSLPTLPLSLPALLSLSLSPI